MEALIRKIGPVAHLFDKGVDIYIGGGWLRDTALGREVKDVDVFCNSDDADKVRDLLEHTEPVDKSITPHQNVYGSDPDILCVYKGTSRFFEEPVDIICCAIDIDEQVLTKRFYAGLCKIVYGPRGLYVHDAFVQDAEEETITYFWQSWHKPRIARKLDQLYAKYPEFEKVTHIRFAATLDDI